MRKKLTTALATTAAASAIVTATAFAHTEVKSTYPGKNKSVSTRLSSVSVTFTGSIRSGSIRVTGPSGTISSGSGGRDPRNVKRLRVAVKSGAKRAGTYTARWTMKAADGHTQSGSFKFKLK
jgi:methionine-rich copper-binding protein CopC